MLSEGYVVIDDAPSPHVAVDIRRRAGLSPKTLQQTSLALDGSWATVHVVHVATGAVVGMGRVIGDGGWYFHVTDMAVLPDHQRRGIGAAVLTRLVDRIETAAPPGAYITLLADAPGRPLYRSHGFVETAPDSIGMVLRR
ncbi:MAG TPA: GNAT family N-acetyltransferase [Desertimonas sp.]|nr:GNAT family N-acetyltransferase [Desertimonas sp.]